MNKIPFLILILIFTSSCEFNSNKLEWNKLNEEIAKKDKQISDLQKQIEDLEKTDKQRLENGEQKLIDKKDFKDTLDISDNFFVYKHTSKIMQTTDSKFESILENFDQVKSVYGNGFFVRVMTFYNGQSLPLETENSKTDIHILIQPTELGYKNKTFVISDFYDIDLKSLVKKDNGVELTFEHGKFPRKTERIIIGPDSVKFEEK